MYIHRIHELYLLTILLHIRRHLNVLIFLLHSLYLLSNILHIYFHRSILVYHDHVFYYHFFPILRNILLDFRIRRFALIRLGHRLLMEDIFRIIWKFLPPLFWNWGRLWNEWKRHLRLRCFFLGLNIGKHFYELNNLGEYFGILLCFLLVWDCFWCNLLVNWKMKMVLFGITYLVVEFADRLFLLLFFLWHNYNPF